MCLTITIRAKGLNADVRRQLAARFPVLHGNRRDGVMSAHACDLLSDDADWNAATWELTPDGRRALSEAVAGIFAALSDEIEIEALWDGEQATVEKNLGRPDLMSLVQGAGLGTRTRYRVGP